MLLAYDGFVAVLKEMSMTAVTVIVVDGISREKTSHEGG
jgi:hypothetical protein